MCLCVCPSGTRLLCALLGNKSEEPEAHHTNDVGGKIFAVSRATILALRDTFCGLSQPAETETNRIRCMMTEVKRPKLGPGEDLCLKT